MEDLQNVMDPPTAEEPLGSRAESRCGQEGQRDVEKMHVRACLRRSVHALRLRRTPGRPERVVALGRNKGEGKKGRAGRRLDEKQQDACLAALLGHLHVQLDTKGIVSLFVSLAQYKQITHGPMERAKHRAQCIQKHVSYRERIHQTIYSAHSTKQLSADASLGGRRAADLREQAAVVMRPALTQTRKSLKGNAAFFFFFNSHVPQRSAFVNNCTPKLETRDPRMSCPQAEKKATLDNE